MTKEEILKKYIVENWSDKFLHILLEQKHVLILMQEYSDLQNAALIERCKELEGKLELMPKINIEKCKIDLHDGCFYTAELIGIKGMVVQAETKEQAIEDLMTSIKVKLLYDIDCK